MYFRGSKPVKKWPKVRRKADGTRRTLLRVRPGSRKLIFGRAKSGLKLEGFFFGNHIPCPSSSSSSRRLGAPCEANSKQAWIAPFLREEDKFLTDSDHLGTGKSSVPETPRGHWSSAKVQQLFEGLSEKWRINIYYGESVCNQVRL